MEKKNKGKVVIVILVLMVLGLGGYIVYDKVLNKEVNEPIKTEKKEEKKSEVDSGFNIEKKSELQALNISIGRVYITKDGDAFLTIDDFATQNIGMEKTAAEQLKKLQQKTAVEGYCGNQVSQIEGHCDSGNVVNSIKLDVDNVVSAYYLSMGQSIDMGKLMFVKQDGTISSIDFGALFDGKVVVENNYKNLKNIVTVVQSATTSAASGYNQAIAIEKDGTQHILEN